ncbi:MAG: hypothetical protein QOI14_694, partial [Actinomycetota bacterium]|nr:hypothetical protein [Actinomycetota bacterium]
LEDDDDDEPQPVVKPVSVKPAAKRAEPGAPAPYDSEAT